MLTNFVRFTSIDCQDKRHLLPNWLMMALYGEFKKCEFFHDENILLKFIKYFNHALFALKILSTDFYPRNDFIIFEEFF